MSMTIRRIPFSHTSTMPEGTEPSACVERIRAGMTRLEIAIVLLALMLIANISAPAILEMRETARRQICQWRLKAIVAAAESYHDVHMELPPAAVWKPPGKSIALHLSRQIGAVSYENWLWSLLPHLGQPEIASRYNSALPTGADENRDFRTTHLSLAVCPTDALNVLTNPYLFDDGTPDRAAVAFARGNYAINGGSHNHRFALSSAEASNGDVMHLELDEENRAFRMWGNGVAGINRAFRISDFVNGRSSLAAFEELRAGVHVIDPRGVWALGQPGGSITWSHGVNGDDGGPNNQHQRADDILGGPALHDQVGEAYLTQQRMPCVSYIDANQQATARSMHPGGVNVAFLDGAVRFISDDIDGSLWHVLHSRETPPAVLKDIWTSRADQDASEATASTPTAQVPMEDQFSNSTGMQFRRIGPGQVLMGEPDDYTAAPPECPPHLVTMSSFFIGVHEVCQDAFRDVMGDRSGGSSDGGDALIDGKLPVTDVTWLMAEDFCKQLSNRPEEFHLHRMYRLPTEAEWEYACRGDVKRPTATLQTPRERLGLAPVDRQLIAVDLGKPNEHGLFHIEDNAWEWNADWYARDYYRRSPERDPTGPAIGFLKVVRGRRWRFSGEPCLIDYAIQPPWKGNRHVGFRVVCEVMPPKTSHGVAPAMRPRQLDAWSTKDNSQSSSRDASVTSVRQ